MCYVKSLGRRGDRRLGPAPAETRMSARETIAERTAGVFALIGRDSVDTADKYLRGGSPWETIVL